MSTEPIAYIREQFEELITNWTGPVPAERLSVIDALFIFRIILGRSPDLETEFPHIRWSSQSKTFRDFIQDIVSSHEFSRTTGFMPANRRLMAELEDFRFWFDTSDRDMGARMALGLYEPETIAFFRKVVRPGMVCLDVGAQTGFYTCLLAKLVGPEGRVFAYEPNPSSFELLAKNVVENGFSDYVSASNTACSNTRGRIPMTLTSGMFVADTHAADARFIECVSLDEEDLPTPDFIKIDVEGHEPAVLEGMSGILRTGRPIILMELNGYWLSNNSTTTGGAVIKFMNDNNYDVSMVETPQTRLNWRTFTQSNLDNCNVIAVPADRV